MEWKDITKPWWLYSQLSLFPYIRKLLLRSMCRDQSLVICRANRLARPCWYFLSMRDLLYSREIWTSLLMTTAASPFSTGNPSFTTAIFPIWPAIAVCKLLSYSPLEMNETNSTIETTAWYIGIGRTLCFGYEILTYSVTLSMRAPLKPPCGLANLKRWWILFTRGSVVNIW